MMIGLFLSSRSILKFLDKAFLETHTIWIPKDAWGRLQATFHGLRSIGPQVITRSKLWLDIIGIIQVPDMLSSRGIVLVF